MERNLFTVNRKQFKLSEEEGLLSTIEGNTLILFESVRSEPCKTFKKYFIAASKKFPSVNFGVFDILDPENQFTIQFSQKTTTPIKKMPTVVFFHDHYPVSVFKDKVPEDFENFIAYVLDEINSEKQAEHYEATQSQAQAMPYLHQNNTRNFGVPEGGVKIELYSGDDDNDYYSNILKKNGTKYSLREYKTGMQHSNKPYNVLKSSFARLEK